MGDWVGFLLRSVYFYCHFVGLNNFEYDWRTGRVFKSWRSSLYAFTVNAVLTISLIFYWIVKKHNTNLIFVSANKLHEYVTIIIAGLKITTGLITVLNRWLQRSQIMRLTKDIIRLYLANPQVKKMIRWGILLKLFSGCAIDLFQVLLFVDSASRQAQTVMLGIFLRTCISFISNLALSQHYFVMLFVRAQYQIANMKLRQVIEESRRLSYLKQRKGVFMTRCCYLSDQVDDIAKVQSQLQSILAQLGEVFGIQGLMFYSGYYISSIGVYYLTYSVYRYGHENLNMTVNSMVLGGIWCAVFYIDALINCFNMLYMWDHHGEMLRLLEQRTIFASSLDVRLEESFESLQLQLARNPLKMDVMNIFPITRSSTAAMCGSVLANSIFLIQFDMEYF
ncbi:putative gustatory receptor 36b [Drosophila eugracilis]|uniref:putative gustatory receptor 36b n=1 Tax=Drosophila eugracilis TaxID=29029 RepID=UPI0007E79C85|nr:putative gustatory receptor 36b [Drosophila eugracilis]